LFFHNKDSMEVLWGHHDDNMAASQPRTYRGLWSNFAFGYAKIKTQIMTQHQPKDHSTFGSR